MTACVETIRFQGQPCLRLSLPQGDSALISLQGAQVLSWVSAGRERLYLSPVSRWDGQTAIRGGIPVCFPQFNRRGTLPKHGFVRNLLWVPQTPDWSSNGICQSLVLASSEATRQWWPQAFESTITVSLLAGVLQVKLDVRNTGDTALTFTGALHTYLAVNDIAQAQLQGLGGQREWDAVADVYGHADAILRFAGEFDRVYTSSPQVLSLQDGNGQLHISQSASLAQSVVWNPGPFQCTTLPDMPADGYRHMLCVEAAQVDVPVEVLAGCTWQGWQRFSVA